MTRILRFLNALEEYTLGFYLLALALFACVQVFTRYVLGHSFTWFEELSRYSCVFITFLGASLGIKYSTHFTMSALVDRLPFRFRHLLTASVYLACAAFFVVVAYYGAIHAHKHFKFGNLSSAMRLPMWAPYLPIPLFSTVMAGRCLIVVYRNLAKAVKGEPGSREVSPACS